ncbi:hypothetical protein FHR92_003063 [Fontibacillus solani]|uniref:Uncharacterized protein n=1 Tax=Fontibacillus solani TaxID=1572857 RepID=A0A7W3XSH5_9BACL|nr:hypothetical protein [Fontibacillus solani]
MILRITKILFSLLFVFRYSKFQDFVLQIFCFIVVCKTGGYAEYGRRKTVRKLQGG